MHLWAKTMMHHHQWKCHLFCVCVCLKIAIYYSWNINSALSFNWEGIVYCTHIRLCPLLYTSLELDCFYSHSTLSISSISNIRWYNFTHMHTHAYKLLQTGLNKFRIDARVKFTTTNRNEKSSIHSSFFILSRTHSLTC